MWLTSSGGAGGSWSQAIQRLYVVFPVHSPMKWSNRRRSAATSMMLKAVAVQSATPPSPSFPLSRSPTPSFPLSRSPTPSSPLPRSPTPSSPLPCSPCWLPVGSLRRTLAVSPFAMRGAPLAACGLRTTPPTKRDGVPAPVDLVMDGGVGGMSPLPSLLSRSTADLVTGLNSDLATGSTFDLATGLTSGLTTGSTSGLATRSTSDLATGSTTDLATGSTFDLATRSTSDLLTADLPTGSTSDFATGSTSNLPTGSTFDRETESTSDLPTVDLSQRGRMSPLGWSLRRVAETRRLRSQTSTAAAGAAVATAAMTAWHVPPASWSRLLALIESPHWENMSSPWSSLSLAQTALSLPETALSLHPSLSLQRSLLSSSPRSSSCRDVPSAEQENVSLMFIATCRSSSRSRPYASSSSSTAAPFLASPPPGGSSVPAVSRSSDRHGRSPSRLAGTSAERPVAFLDLLSRSANTSSLSVASLSTCTRGGQPSSMRPSVTPISSSSSSSSSSNTMTSLYRGPSAVCESASPAISSPGLQVAPAAAARPIRRSSVCASSTKLSMKLSRSGPLSIASLNSGGVSHRPSSSSPSSTMATASLACLAMVDARSKRGHSASVGGRPRRCFTPSSPPTARLCAPPAIASTSTSLPLVDAASGSESLLISTGDDGDDVRRRSSLRARPVSCGRPRVDDSPRSAARRDTRAPVPSRRREPPAVVSCPTPSLPCLVAGVDDAATHEAARRVASHAGTATRFSLSLVPFLASAATSGRETMGRATATPAMVTARPATARPATVGPVTGTTAGLCGWRRHRLLCGGVATSLSGDAASRAMLRVLLPAVRW